PDDLGIDAEEVVAAHAGLPRHARGHDADVGAADVGVVVGALEIDVEAFDRPALEQIERLSLRHPFDDVEEDDVAEPLESAEVREGAADHSGTDERDLLPWHGRISNRKTVDGASRRWSHSSHHRARRSSMASKGSARTTSSPPWALATVQRSPSSR